MDEVHGASRTIGRRRALPFIAAAAMVACAVAFGSGAVGHSLIPLEAPLAGVGRAAFAVVAIMMLLLAGATVRATRRFTVVVDETSMRFNRGNRVERIHRAEVITVVTFVPCGNLTPTFVKRSLDARRPEADVTVALLGRSGSPLVVVEPHLWDGDVAGVLRETWRIEIQEHGRSSRKDLSELYPGIEWPKRIFYRADSSGGGA